MAFDFPASPANGAQFTPVPGGPTYVYDSAATAWKISTGGLSTGVWVGDSPPLNPINGQLWFESDTGMSFIYYIDADSSQWVQWNMAPLTPAEYIASIPVDMWAGFKTTGKFVINDKVDGSGVDRWIFGDNGTFSGPNGGTLSGGALDRFYISEGQFGVQSNGYQIILTDRPATANLYLGAGNISGSPQINFQIAGTTKMVLNTNGGINIQPAAGQHTVFAQRPTGAGMAGVYAQGQLNMAAVIGYATGDTIYGAVGMNTGGQTWSFYASHSSLAASGSWQTSDERIKENIEPIDPAAALDVVKQIQAKRYFNKVSERDEAGWIAQDVQDVIPEAVLEAGIPESDQNLRTIMGLPKEGDATMLTMNDKTMIATLWAACTALIARVEQLETR